MQSLSFKDTTFKTTQKQMEKVIVFRDIWPSPRRCLSLDYSGMLDGVGR